MKLSSAIILVAIPVLLFTIVCLAATYLLMQRIRKRVAPQSLPEFPYLTSWEKEE